MSTLLRDQQQQPINILLVEDDDGDAKAVKRAFKSEKIANNLVRAIDGVEALEFLRGTNGNEKLKKPYLLLVDLNMPRMDGISLVKELRKDDALKDTIIFILTTSKKDEDMAAAYNLNVAGYILKETAGKDFMQIPELLDCYWRIVEIPL